MVQIVCNSLRLGATVFFTVMVSENSADNTIHKLRQTSAAISSHHGGDTSEFVRIVTKGESTSRG